MKILYIFCLLCSVIVLAVEDGKDPVEAPKTTQKKTTIPGEAPKTTQKKTTITTTTTTTTTTKKAPDTTKKETTTAALNKLQCPACSDLTTDVCEEEMASCRGSQIFCLNSTGKVVREDNSISEFVVNRCDTAFILTTLLGEEFVKPGRYDIKLIFEMARPAPTEKPTEAPTEKPTEATSQKTSKAAANKTPNKKPTTATPKPSGSPSISPGLFFTLWLPSVSYLLLMHLLS